MPGQMHGICAVPNQRAWWIAPARDKVDGGSTELDKNVY